MKKGDLCFVEIENFLNGRVEKIRKIHNALPSLQDAQSQYVLLRSCLNVGRVNYLLRTVHPMFMEKARLEFNELSRASLETIINRPINDQNWRQATLPVKKSGLGISKACDISKIAYISSRLSTKSVSHAILKKPRADEIWDVNAIHEIFTSLELSNIQLSDCVSQKGLSDLINKRNYALLYNSMKELDNKRDLARFSASSDKYSSCFLNVVPNPVFGTRMLSEEFQTTLQYRLGIPFLPPFQSCGHKFTCPKCCKPLDVWGDHGLECHFGGGLIRRHDDLRDIIFSAALQAHFTKHLLSNPAAKPGDINRYFYPSLVQRQTCCSGHYYFFNFAAITPQPCIIEDWVCCRANKIV